MLRVRPIVSTSDLPRYGSLLSALGLRVALGDGGCRVYDAGGGRLVLQSPQPGGAGANAVELGFEVGDSPGNLDEFVRRTRQAGTSVDVVGQDHRRAARVSAPGSTTFLAVPGPRAVTPPGIPLGVVAHWHTADTEAAARVLLDIGARSRRISPDGTWRDFTAKNGGVVAVHPAAEASVTLGFEYDGDVRGLAGTLEVAGFEHSVIDGAVDRSLHLRIPGHFPVLIGEKR
ncbi:hypothetical protein [Arthrobacter sp. H41]|uniref:hypothetical protein n=1 Tax=Arthrobacter sp. H41 TaxID=1312978 RepID=UPI0004B9DCE0|nr:hypothetical protein [Arthrobacter sp. H41]